MGSGIQSTVYTRFLMPTLFIPPPVVGSLSEDLFNSSGRINLLAVAVSIKRRVIKYSTFNDDKLCTKECTYWNHNFMSFVYGSEKR